MYRSNAPWGFKIYRRDVVVVKLLLFIAFAVVKSVENESAKFRIPSSVRVSKVCAASKDFAEAHWNVTPDIRLGQVP